MAKEKIEKPIKSFFDIANIIFKKLNRPSDEDIQKHCQQWMLNMYLSSDQTLAPIAAELSKYQISNKEYFDVLYHGIPKIDRFIRYTAQRQKKDNELLCLCKYYGCSPEIGKSYLKLINEKELEYIVDIYEKKGIKK